MPRLLDRRAVVIVLAAITTACGSSAKKSFEPTAVTSTSIPAGTVAQRAAYDEQLSTFATMLNVAGVVNTVNGKGAYTVFAPTNDALAKVRHARLTALLGASGRRDLRRLVEMHVVPGTQNPLEPGSLRSASGMRLTVTKNGAVVSIRDGSGHTVHVVGAPLLATNGVVYRVDGVLAGPVSLG